jgi:hypothetical protein
LAKIKLFYYKAHCDGRFEDVIISDRRLHPGLVREIPDARGDLHRVRGVNQITRQDYLSWRGAQKARCAG